LLLGLNKISLFVVFILVFTGCQKRYSSGSYSSKSYRTSPQYHKLENQEIKDSPAMHKATMRPYEVLGKTYYPTVASVGDEFEGISSWYGPDFHEKKTSSGEIYDMFAYTAASKTLPMNTMVQVYNKDNGKSVTVRINDRGPFVDGRIIDLSNSAAKDIGMVGAGTANVKLTILGFHSKVATTAEEKKEVAETGKYYVQIGAFTNLNGAKMTKDKFNNTILEKEYKAIIKQTNNDGKLINRVWVSGFKSESEANDFKKENGLMDAMVIAQ
jgi:rare lipoprotein A